MDKKHNDNLTVNLGQGLGCPACAYLLAIILSAGAALAASDSIPSAHDPYEILERSYDAVGGLDRLKSVETLVTEGSIVFEDSMFLDETFVSFQSGSVKYREEARNDSFQSMSGDNGFVEWHAMDGEVWTFVDDHAKRTRQFRKQVDDFEHLNRNHKHLRLQFDGLELKYGGDNFVISLTTDQSDSRRVFYIDTTTFLQKALIVSFADTVIETVYSDYREVCEVSFAFRADMVMIPGDIRSAIIYTRMECNVQLDTAIFDPPSMNDTR